MGGSRFKSQWGYIYIYIVITCELKQSEMMNKKFTKISSQVQKGTYSEVSNVAHSKSQCNLYHCIIKDKPEPQDRC